MTKGRTFVPTKDREGNWFQTRGWPRTFPVPAPKQTISATTLPCPRKFEEKAETPYRNFRFSKHDNRHTLQDHGVYFGNGLGKKKTPEKSQHYSNNMITWSMNNNNQSNYMTSFRGQSADGATSRRFPRIHPEPKPGTAPLQTSTTNWFMPPQVPYRTPLNVLAITQEPLLPSNSWTYSYRPIWS
ncbi:testis-expressed protein 36 [Nematostella vectensis]|uniref:testis-expressed protein 36 n=1 Tax=Nematostella vectensis TaxID=45351 RepID=UPI00207703A0|nr:testis-expressed protein 36 [Nematostella vectensis]